MPPIHSWFHTASWGFTLQLGNTPKESLIYFFCIWKETGICVHPWSSSVWGRRVCLGVPSQLQTGIVLVGNDLGPCCRGQSHVNKWMFLGSSTNALKPLRKKHKTRHSLKPEQLGRARPPQRAPSRSSGTGRGKGDLGRPPEGKYSFTSSSMPSWVLQLPQGQQKLQTVPVLVEELCWRSAQKLIFQRLEGSAVLPG